MRHWLPALFWMMVIYYLSGRNAEQLQSMFPFISNFNPGHLVAYFLLAIFYYRALSKVNQPRPYLKTFLLCLAFGVTDEIHQYFVPGRCPDIGDLIVDLTGAALALAVIYSTQKNKTVK